MALAQWLAAALMLVGALAAVDGKPGDAPFCRSVVQSLLKCPAVPTVDTVDLNQYAGRWYEIGVSAQFAFAYFGQQGAQCVSANYTPLGVTNGQNSLKVVNRALSVSSTVREVQALAISQGSFASGAGVRFLCQFLVGEESLGSLFPALAKADHLLPNLAKLTNMKLFKNLVKGAAGKGALMKLHNLVQTYATNRRLKSLTNDQISTLVEAVVNALVKLPADIVSKSAGAIKGAVLKSGLIKGGAVSGNQIQLTAATAAAAPAGASAPTAATAGAVDAVSMEASQVVKAAKSVFNSYTKAEWQGIITSSLKMVSMFASMPNGTINSPISVVGLTSIITVASTLSDTLSDVAKLQIKTEVVQILTAVDAASAAAGEVFRVLAAIQGNNNVLTGATLPAPFSLPKVKAGIELNLLKLKALEKALAKAKQDILASATAILGMASKIDSAVARAAYGITVFANGQGPINLALQDIAGGGSAIEATTSTLSPENAPPSLNEVEGSAVQSAGANPVAPGALTVSFFGPPTGQPNYKIIKLEGDAAQGYDLALVFSCSAGFTSAFLPENAFFILSRTPTVPQSVIDASLAFAAEKGIVLAGENPFLTVSHDAQLCAPVTSLA